MNKIKKSCKLRGYLIPVITAGIQEYCAGPIIHNLSAFFTYVFYGVTTESFMKGIVITDKNHNTGRKLLIGFSSCQYLHIHLTVIVSGAQRQIMFVDDLHFYIIASIFLISCKDIQTNALIFRMINNTLLPIYLHTGNINAKNALQHGLTVLGINHDSTEHKVVFQCQFT